MTIIFGRKKEKPVMEASVECDDTFSVLDFIDKYGPWIQLGLVMVTLYHCGKCIAYTDIAKQAFRR